MRHGDTDTGTPNHYMQVTIYEEVDVKKLSRSERSQLVESALATQDIDNEPFFRRVRERIDRWACWHVAIDNCHSIGTQTHLAMTRRTSRRDVTAGWG